MITVSKAGVVGMEASGRFKYEIAPELGLRDVFKLKREYMSSKLRFEDCLEKRLRVSNIRK